MSMEEIDIAALGLVPESDEDIQDQIDAALKEGDMEKLKRLNGMVAWDPETLDFFKRARPAGHIEKWNYNTILADRKYGKGWLDA